MVINVEKNKSSIEVSSTDDSSDIKRLESEYLTHLKSIGVDTSFWEHKGKEFDPVNIDIDKNNVDEVNEKTENGQLHETYLDDLRKIGSKKKVNIITALVLSVSRKSVPKPAYKSEYLLNVHKQNEKVRGFQHAMMQQKKLSAFAQQHIQNQMQVNNIDGDKDKMEEVLVDKSEHSLHDRIAQLKATQQEMLKLDIDESTFVFDATSIGVEHRAMVGKEKSKWEQELNELFNNVDLPIPDCSKLLDSIKAIFSGKSPQMEA